MIYGVPSKRRVEELKRLYPRRFVDYDGNIVHDVPDGKDFPHLYGEKLAAARKRVKDSGLCYREWLKLNEKIER